MLKKLKASIVIQLIFVVSIALSAITIYSIYSYQHQKARLAIQNLSHIYVNLIESTINQALSATFPLAAMVKKQQISADQFSQFATEMLPFYPNIAALQLAPGGIIRYTAPLAGNEKAIGHNLLTAPNRNKESVATKNSGKLTLAGPFNLVQGGYGAAGRLPIYLDRPNGEAYFWGFATVLLRFPQVLAPVKLSALVDAGLSYELSRVHPDTAETQVLTRSPTALSADPIINKINIANVTWTLKVSNNKAGAHYISILMMSLLGIVLTILVTFSAISILRIRDDKAGLKNIVTARTKELDDNLKRLNLALTSAGQIWFELNVQSGDISFGGQTGKMAGYAAADMKTTLQFWLQSIHPDDLESASKKYQQSLLKGVPFELEYRRKSKDGHWLWIQTIGEFTAWDEQQKPLWCTGVHTDISQRKQQQQKLELMAHYDILTKLPNRSLLAERFKLGTVHSQQSGSMLAVCFLDLDNFKPVNDSYGHDIGDQLLIEVAQRLSLNIDVQDTASRQGGDEFVLLLEDIKSLDHCKEILARINNALAQPYLIAGYTFNISASIGVTLYPDNNADLDTLLRHADYSMYQAKLAGKNRIHLFNPEQYKQKTQKNQLLDEIEQALSNNEFTLYYQPKINMKTGEVYGAEALIRWLHPEKGLIPPLDFLPIIEGSALEIKVGDWVINQALQQAVTWQKQGIFIEVSVNIACYHLISATFLAQLKNALASYPHFNAKYLQLEILESGALTDLDTMRGILNTCRNEFGVNIALDDFGTGYSSLTHLKDLPANTIKIDQSFVKNMLEESDDYAIINGVLALAGSFNRDVIAEGVETTEHGLMLIEMGCYAGQGYGIARPMPAAALPNWLHSYIPNQQWLDSGNIVRQSKIYS
ncbi:EAL domain-containing protein [Moritella marina]|uniref:bifunctional diguanylate cyclase/phosphodiesterase n=1 Tax=Moritella marina TaxID=90736 RepID=UPI0037044665